MFLVPARIIFWGRLDLFFIFYFHKMRKENEKKKKKKKTSENPTEIKQRGKQIFFFSAMNCSSLFCFNYFSITLPKNVKKIHQINQENMKKIDGFVVYPPNSAPKPIKPVLIYLNFGSLNIV